jgi:hypothetical protein
MTTVPWQNVLQNTCTMFSVIYEVVQDTQFIEFSDLWVIFNIYSIFIHSYSHMMGLSGHLLTKQHFTNVMLDFKHASASPVRALPQALPTSVNNPQDQSLPQDCWDVQELGHNTSGIYRIKPYLSSVPFFVYCQLEARGGGWTVSCMIWEHHIC